MLKNLIPALVLLTIPASHVQAQDAESIKKSLLEKVRARLADERAKILKKIRAILEEEFAKKEGKKPDKGTSDLDKRIKELERKMRLLDEQREELSIEIAKTRRFAEDEALKKEAKEKGPQDFDEAKALFDDALNNHNAKDYDSSIQKFKTLSYAFPSEEIGTISAYNVACGYALKGDKDRALDWLELCIKGGYDDYDHLRKDTDFDSVRNEKRYKKLLADK